MYMCDNIQACGPRDVEIWFVHKPTQVRSVIEYVYEIIHVFDKVVNYSYES